jgi:RNA polymerase sigma factor (sigma-70 family)
MPNMKSLILNYQTNGCEESFETIYATFADKLFNTAFQQTRQRRLNWADTESEANFVLLEAIRSYDVTIGEFEPYLFLMLRRRIADIGRNSANYRSYVDQYMVDAPTSTANEPEVSAIKKEQRQLLDLLNANADNKSRQAFQAFASSESYREAAKLLGVNHETVKNRIEKMSATKQNLSLSDYLTA